MLLYIHAFYNRYYIYVYIYVYVLFLNVLGRKVGGADKILYIHVLYIHVQMFLLDVLSGKLYRSTLWMARTRRYIYLCYLIPVHMLHTNLHSYTHTYICMHTYLTYIYIYISTYILTLHTLHTNMYISTCITYINHTLHLYVYISTYFYIRTITYIRPNMHWLMHTSKHIHMHTHLYTEIHYIRCNTIHTYIHVYPCTFTYKPIQCLTYFFFHLIIYIVSLYPYMYGYSANSRAVYWVSNENTTREYIRSSSETGTYT